jgi:hypothetical protein
MKKEGDKKTELSGSAIPEKKAMSIDSAKLF